MTNIFGLSKIGGILDTVEELQSLYEPTNTGTTTNWFIADLPILIQVVNGYAYNEVQSGSLLVYNENKRVYLKLT